MAAAAVSAPPALPSSTPSNRRTSSGLVHNVKRAVFGPNKSAAGDDSEFKTALDEFNSLNQLLTELRTNVTLYNKAVTALTASSRNTTNTFADILRDTARPNQYADTLITSTQAHNELVEELEKAGGVYTRDILNDIDQQTALHKTLTTRIDERMKLRTDFLYYELKMKGLAKERDERLAKGKAEKAADTEKLERNNHKLTESNDRYRAHNAELMHDLHTLFISRLKTYGPVLKQFVLAEKRFSSDYYQCMQSVDREDGIGGQLADGGLSINVSAAMQQRSVGLVAEHSPMVDALMTPSNPFHENDEEFAPSPVGGLTPTHVLRANVSSVSSSFASAAAALPRNTMSDGDGAVPPYYPYEHQQYGDEAMAAAHNGPPASAPMLSPPYQQGISFSQPQWPNMSQQEVAVVGGPRVEYSDPFANASFNPFDDLDDHQPAAAVAAAPASNSSFFPFPTARPSASHSAVPEYHPAPYVPVPYQPVAAPAAVVAPPAPVVVLGASELEAVGEQDGEVEEEVVDGDTFEDAEGLAGGEVGEEEPEGIPSAALAAPAPAAAPAHVPMPTPIPAAVVAAAPPSPPYAAPPPPAVVPSPPRSSFASLHSASAPRPPTIPPRSPTSMPPPPPSSRPTPPTSKPVHRPPPAPVVVPEPRSPSSPNPFDDD